MPTTSPPPNALLPDGWRDWPPAAKQQLLDRLRDVAGGQFAHRPAEWIPANLGDYLWDAQRRICESVIVHRYTAVPACHGPGKTRGAADIGHWWLSTRQDPFLITSAPTAAQVESILWREINGQHQTHARPGRITFSGYPKWHVGGRLVGIGRKPSDYDVDTFQGIHALNVLVVFDEASGIPPDLWDQADGLMTNSNARMLVIGNPTDPQSQFEKVCKPGSGWNVIRIDGLRLPTLTAEALAPFPRVRALMDAEGIAPSTEILPERLTQLLTGPEWIDERIDRWGVGSALWLSRVRAIFPAEADADAVIPLAWVVAAQDRWQAWKVHELQPPGRSVFGVDVGRSEDADENVVARRHGHVVFPLETWRVKDLTHTTSRVAALLRSQPSSVAVVDETGIGAGVLDQLRQDGCSAIGFVAAGKSQGSDRNGEFQFANLRAEAWWRLREALDPAHNPDLCLPPDDQLAADLTAPRWKLVRHGVIQIESKDDIRKRLGRSTDRGDAVVQSLVTSTMVGADDEVVPWSGPEAERRASDEELLADWFDQFT